MVDKFPLGRIEDNLFMKKKKKKTTVCESHRLVLEESILIRKGDFKSFCLLST